jgi:hypothetical protein
MNKQATQGGTPNHPNGSSPPWWTTKHATAWEGAKEALRRDWEQTVSDLTPNGGAQLNQSVGDTLLQATGNQVVPSRTTKTHPDQPEDVARRARRELEDHAHAQEKVVAAQIEVAAAQMKADGKIAQERHDAQEKIERIQKKIGEIAVESREAIAVAERDGQSRLAKQQVKIDEVRAEVSDKVAKVRERTDEKIAAQREKIVEARKAWAQVEPAVRYGYGARFEYADGHAWGDAVEGRLRTGWAELKTGGTWEEARPFVRHGWDAVRLNHHA